MIAEHFEKVVRPFQKRAPFRPFTVELSSGTRIDADHPEALVLRGGVAVFLSAAGVPTAIRPRVRCASYRCGWAAGRITPAGLECGRCADTMLETVVGAAPATERHLLWCTGNVMANGKQGDHPLTDILAHGLTVYSAEADELIRKIARLSSAREVGQWWEREIGWKADAADVLAKAQVRHAELLRRARSNGWELPEGAA